MSDLSQARDLPTYELARLLESIPESSAALAMQLGRSRTYVSKLRSTWRGACPSLLRAWKENKLAFDVVKRLAKIKDKKEQAQALADYLRTTTGKTRAAKGEARKTLIHILTCDMDEDCICEEADQLSAEEENRAAAYNSEDCAQCGHMRCVHEPVCFCDDHEFVEKENQETMSETNNERRQ